MLWYERIGFACWPIAQRFASLVVHDNVVKDHGTDEESSLFTHCVFARLRVIYSGLPCMCHSICQRSEGIDTLRMVETRHQLHVAVGILYRHESLVGHLDIGMVVALAAPVYPGVHVFLIHPCFQRHILWVASTCIVTNHAATAPLGRVHVGSQIIARLSYALYL